MAAVWKSLTTLAQVQEQDWTIDLQPNKPNDAIRFSSSNGFVWSALTIEPLPGHSLVPEEIYIRQHDLITRFAQSSSDQYGFQIDYRLIDAPESFDLAVEVWLSVQTTLLDSTPKFKLSSSGDGQWSVWSHRQLLNGESAKNNDSATHAKVSDRAAMLVASTRASGLWLIDPSDQAQLHWSADSSANQPSAELFGAFLEKGVIRRARMQFLVSRDQVDFPAVQRAYDQLITRDLPLTA